MGQWCINCTSTMDYGAHAKVGGAHVYVCMFARIHTSHHVIYQHLTLNRTHAIYLSSGCSQKSWRGWVVFWVLWQLLTPTCMVLTRALPPYSIIMLMPAHLGLRLSSPWLMIAFITCNSSLVPLLEGLYSSSPCRFDFSVFWVFATIERMTSGLTVPRSDQLS